MNPSEELKLDIEFADSNKDFANKPDFISEDSIVTGLVNDVQEASNWNHSLINNLHAHNDNMQKAKIEKLES